MTHRKGIACVPALQPGLRSAAWRVVAGILILVAFFSDLKAQVKGDSLLNVWVSEKQPDTLRLQAVNTLAWSLLSIYPDSTFNLSNRELIFARQKKLPKWEGRALYNIATYYYGRGDFVQAFSYYRQSLAVRSKINDLKGMAAIYGSFGMIYNQQGNNLKALDFQLQALALNTKIKDTMGLSFNYSNLAVIYQDQHNSAKALAYYEENLKLFNPVKQKDNIALTYNNMANIYSADNKFRTALEYLDKSLLLRTELDDRIGMAVNYVNIGSNYACLLRYDTALVYMKKGLAIFEAVDDKASMSNTYFNLGDIEFKQHKHKNAIYWCEKAFKLAGEIGKVPIQRVASECLYQTYKAMGNEGKALAYHEQFVVLNDSLKQEEIEMKLNQIEFEKEVLSDSLSQVKEKELIRLAYQSSLNGKTQSRNVILIISIVILFLALLFLSRMLYFQKTSDEFKFKTQQLEKQQLLSEIDLLKTQVNPHFLFNSLSILSSLVHVNADLSEQFIDQLSRSYRYILEQKDQTLVSLRTETEFIRSYAFLLKIRFEKKFDLQIRLDEADLDRYKIAPLTLQLLVENAVKHNRMSVAEPLVVEVYVEDAKLIVKNRLQLRPKQLLSTGTGLNNIIDRYGLLTDRRVWAGECEDAFVVKVPLLLT